ncbi:hypothetical protein FB45DRAFT_1038237 [Roridomyces roridus]|uniref:Extracellular membrane protein CFEM domain-containing protein n=1 Tax=Roridomyces roridus TaxID=1738132 RepID=A0AAD7B4E8_9AGAR|nr:hypothetical protein FB45DRAFT_1038237 [Roridomyces roridus]
MKFSTQLAALLFAVLPFATAAPGTAHCDLICVAVDCGDLPVAFYDCFGDPCACVEPEVSS